MLLTPLAYAAPGCINATAKEIATKSKKYDETILAAAKKYHVDNALIRSVIAIESCYNGKAVSPAGARGLMQLIPDTEERFGVTDGFNATQNINAGTRYLRFLSRRYQGNLNKVLAAYNAGEGKVDYYNGIPPYKETQKYVKNVLLVYGNLRPEARDNPLKPAIEKAGEKPGRQGWRYLKARAPHLFKQGS